MKKLLLSLIALPMMAFGFTSCSDEDDLPEAKIEVRISGGVQNPDDNRIYVTEGEQLVFESLTAIPTNGKKTTLGFTTYYIQGIPFAQTYTVPFGATLDTEGMNPGEYVVQIKSELYQIDKSAAFVLISYELVIEPADGDGSDVPPSGSYVATPAHSEIGAQ
ncbi:MAG: hypothetical protein K2G94_07090 [Muribaculaceae bacterium]|nr:hypothetical protein [Muribaculaceae bacterium]MDE5972495.1 hypothetical protein [Muribaculaceae bacterium]MDE6461755.1 hypothetical protein [Muribaculaceae bacterium]MDE6508920.1 hypothetical protein [Muribaculaceae bacterium]